MSGPGQAGRQAGWGNGQRGGLPDSTSGGRTVVHMGDAVMGRGNQDGVNEKMTVGVRDGWVGKEDRRTPVDTHTHILTQEETLRRAI